MRKWLIDGNKTAMENLFSAARYAALAFKAKAVQAGAVLTKAEWDDFLDDITMRAADMFIEHKVIGKEYDRKFSFFCNVRSCVWSRFYGVLSQHMRFIKQKICSYDRLEPEKCEHMMEMYSPIRYASKCDKETARNNMKSWLGRCQHKAYLDIEDATDFWSYLESCEETGIPVDKKTTLYMRGSEITGEYVRTKKRKHTK